MERHNQPDKKINTQSVTTSKVYTGDQNDVQVQSVRAPYTYIQPALCTGCGVCIEVCPFDAIHIKDGIAEISKELCKNCKICLRVCPEGAIM